MADAILQAFGPLGILMAPLAMSHAMNGLPAVATVSDIFVAMTLDIAAKRFMTAKEARNGG